MPPLIRRASSILGALTWRKWRSWRWSEPFELTPEVLQSDRPLSTTVAFTLAIPVRLQSRHRNPCPYALQTFHDSFWKTRFTLVLSWTDTSPLAYGVQARYTRVFEWPAARSTTVKATAPKKPPQKTRFREVIRTWAVSAHPNVDRVCLLIACDLCGQPLSCVEARGRYQEISPKLSENPPPASYRCLVRERCSGSWKRTASAAWDVEQQMQPRALGDQFISHSLISCFGAPLSSQWNTTFSLSATGPL